MAATGSGNQIAWLMGDQKEPAEERSEHVQELDKHLQAEIGQELIKICQWSGQRIAEGDHLSVRLLREYLEIFLGSLQPAKVELVLECEEA